MNDKFNQTFIEEASELIEKFEESLMELENEPDNNDIISKVFRALHTLKGSGAMFGFSIVSEFTHEIENVFDLIRNGQLHANPQIIDFALKSKDIVEELIQSQDQVSDELKSQIMQIKSFFNSLANPSSEEPIETNDDTAEKKLTSYKISFKPNQEILLSGTKIELLFDELAEMGDFQVKIYTDSIPTFSKFNPELCYAHWDIFLTTENSDNDIKDVFIFVEDECEIEISPIQTWDDDSDDLHIKQIGEILLEHGKISNDDLQKILSSQKKFGEISVSKGLISKEELDSALEEQNYIKSIEKKKSIKKATSNIRVPSDKLDKIVNLVRELVTFQARLEQIATQVENSHLRDLSEEAERLIWGIREEAMSLRMVSIGTIFNKFQRVVRDLSRDLGKDIMLKTEGGETELDKTIIENLTDPLVHIIRNSVDHGIELPEKRAELGKPKTGTILLKATHSGPNVFIQIKDDGAGLDKESIKKKAIEKKLISETSSLSDHEIFNPIFEPGFSTSKLVTDISGRGVGMDVVRRNIETLKGTIEINSNLGEGTVIGLKIPLTLAIIDTLLVQIGSKHFVLPLAMIEECIEMPQEEVFDEKTQNLVSVRGKLVPYIVLKNYFHIEEKNPDFVQVVIINHEDKQTGIVVDRIIGEYQTVIKSLGRVYQNIEDISGATILGDGSIALIIDLPKLVKKYSDNHCNE